MTFKHFSAQGLLCPFNAEVPPVFETYKAEMKSISVKKGNPFTLHTSVAELHGDELIVWRFGDEGKLLAKEDKETKGSPYYNTDERFRHRLELVDQTGSLTIKNTKEIDAGLYTVKISSNEQTSFKRFIVSVSDVGLSPADVTVFIVVLLLLFAAAAGFGFYCHRRKISKLQKDRKEMKYVQQGESVPLEPDTEIQIDDKIQWMFGDQKCLIAKMGKGETREITYPDERFRDRLQVDKKTGALTIKNITIEHSGDFKVKISSRRRTQIKIFCIIIKEEKVTVMEGRTAVLHSGTEIQTNDQIEWRFNTEESPIAEIKDGHKIFPSDGPGGVFRTTLNLDEKTGSLIIKNIRNEHAGGYYLIIKNRSTKHHDRRFIVKVIEEKVTVMVGDTAVLKSPAGIHTDDQIEWRFKTDESPIAEIKDGQKIFLSDGPGGRFKNTQSLDEKTGSLTIRNIRPEHAGGYQLIIKNRNTGARVKRFTLAVIVEKVRVMEGRTVVLESVAEIRTDDHVEWTFNYKKPPVAEVRDGQQIFPSDVHDGIFKDRLRLDERTGSLTIKNMELAHAGFFYLKIKNSRATIQDKRFTVAVIVPRRNRVKDSATVEFQC
ncbi:titin isoform X2 [Danio rerio]|uniref:Titin isoform X2 n=2 Tax=Danio rerio TaxID=7955 RepID=A0AC58IGJ7_DANRE|nr:uncharacterized protein LOC100006875 isoform X2 [Danio rerio]|eukprot:XP_021325223.1 uncharacterized protein LOC100006875 isoform X2 [Danio rerio]